MLWGTTKVMSLYFKRTEQHLMQQTRLATCEDTVVTLHQCYQLLLYGVLLGITLK